MVQSLVARPMRLLMLLALIAAAAIGLAAPDIVAQQSGNSQADQAIAWLIDQQVDDGGFSAFGGESDPGSTADAIYALVSAGVDPATVVAASGNTPLDYLANTAGDVASNPGQSGKVVLAVIASNEDPADVGGNNLIAAIQQGQDADTGFWGQGPINHSYALLALVAAGADIDNTMIEVLVDSQIEDGSWAFTGSTDPGTGDSNSTAVVIQALVAAGANQDVIDAGVAYILSLQDETGAIAYDDNEAPDLKGDANSTAQAIQALIAAGANADAQIAALGTFQNESGAFFWRSDWADDSLLATAQAIPALLGQALPVDALKEQPQEPGDGIDEALQPADPIEGCRFFSETSHNLCDPFEGYWDDNGGLFIFGIPLTEPFVDENGRTVQYFERARFEHHPENAGTQWEVLLGRLGAEQIDYDAGR